MLGQPVVVRCMTDGRPPRSWRHAHAPGARIPPRLCLQHEKNQARVRTSAGSFSPIVQESFLPPRSSAPVRAPRRAFVREGPVPNKEIVSPGR
jgi:hypothetical protein